jgi:amino acid adenylation domain-containing protein
MAKQHPDATGGRVILPSILATDESSLEVKSMLESLGKLWLAGCTVDWTGFYRHERRRRVALPTYPFERRRFWVEPHKREQPAMPHERVAGPVRAAIEEQLEGVKTAGKSRPFQNEFAEAGPVLARVMAQLENLSGRPRAELSSSATFMEMGFDSLFLAQMSQAIQGKFGIKVTFRQMTEELPTPEALARYIEGGEKGQRTGAISEGRPATGKGNGAATHPLSDGQMEVWLAVQMGEDANRAFNQVFTVRLRGGLNLERLRESVREFARRHDAFRITFAADGSGQTIHPEIRLEVPVIELSSERNADLGLSKVVEEEQRERFDLVSGPLVRAKIVRVSSGDHVLVLAAHHLVLDGWSAGVMLHELSLAYSGGNGLIVPMQYADFLLEQRNAATRAKLAKTEEWWLREFADPPPSVELPADRPRPAKKTFRATQETIVLDESFYRDLKRAAGRQGCTLFTYLFGSFVVWLHRLGGQGEIVVGVPAAGQMNGDGEGQARRALVGHCVNLLPLRCRCEAGVTFEEHLKHVKRVVLDAHEHQPFTFGSLVRALNLPRDSSRLPLVSTTFNLNRLIPRCDWEGTEAEIATPPRSFNIFDLSVDIRDSGTDLKIDCCFNADLFDRDTMARWLGHWRTLLKATLTRPQENVVRLPLLEEDERNRLLVEWNDTLVELPKEAACVHELVEAQVKRTPEAVALEFQDCRLTYGELNARSEQLAENLRRQGIGPGALVGLRMERSLEMVAGMLGILKTGGAYVPLDPNHPKERVEFILKDSEVKVVIGEEQVPRTIQNPGLRIQGSSHHQAAMEAAAYVLYTSGSTGRPKGVVIPHRSLVNFLWSMSQEPGLNSSDVLLAVTTLSFDIAGLEIWLPLICGAKVVIASRETAMDGKRLARKLTESGATVMQATPATWRMLLDAGWAGDSKLKILCGGEAWSEELVRQLLPKCGSLWNMYGPTETTIWSAATRIEKPETPLIGRPIANTQFYVLDREMQPLPVGVPGELHIGGLGLALGYLNRPELTAEKFVPDPFSSRPGARLYKTGDLVRHRDDGRIEFLGRLDHQVKIRGHRIELGEVEAALRDHAGIRDVVVIARGTAGESQLVAYLVARDGAQLEPGELRAFLKERLPEHMMPSAFVVLDALPLSPNGKVDRKNLPPPGVEAAAGASALPQTEMEKSLAEIWCELLGLKRVGIHDDFFELGGHSLAATRLIARLEDFTGEDLSLRDIFDSPTIAKLSARLGG